MELNPWTEIERGSGSKVSGSFVLCHEYVCTNPIEADASASEMKQHLEYLPSVGRVNVSREDIRGGNGEYAWYVTFTDSVGDVSEMLWSRDASSDAKRLFLTAQTPAYL